MDLSEIFLILVVGIIVVGPKRLPVMMRALGRWIARARRTIFEVRANTGIDKLIRDEGLENEVRELSNLARSRGGLASLVANNPIAMATRSISGALETPPARPAAPKAAEAAKSTPKAAVVKELAPDASAPAAALVDVDRPDAPPAQTPMMTGPQPNAAALALIKPAEGAISRRDEDVLRLLMRTATGTTREREYPTIGCDAYDVLPDDIDDPDAYADAPPEGEAGDAPVIASAPDASNTAAVDERTAPEVPKGPEIERTA